MTRSGMGDPRRPAGEGAPLRWCLPLVGLVVLQAGGSAALGLALGWVGVFLSREVIRGFLFGVGPLDPLTLVSGSVGLMGVALLAVAVPARRASRVDPAEALRQS